MVYLCIGRFYGVALAASAMMATTAMQLAIDAFGPISDNAGGIAEMSNYLKSANITDILDSVGILLQQQERFCYCFGSINFIVFALTLHRN
jgi:Na+/H+-translocating membrane pyrophosphatase